VKWSFKNKKMPKNVVTKNYKNEGIYKYMSNLTIKQVTEENRGSYQCLSKKKKGSHLLGGNQGTLTLYGEQ